MTKLVLILISVPIAISEIVIFNKFEPLTKHKSNKKNTSIEKVNYPSRITFHSKRQKLSNFGLSSLTK